MKTYVLTVEVDEGSDEFWEDVATKKAREARRLVRDEIQSALAHAGFTRDVCRVYAVLTRRSTSAGERE